MAGLTLGKTTTLLQLLLIIERLIAVADRALYQAKNDGKNRIGSVAMAIPASNLSAISGAT